MILNEAFNPLDEDLTVFDVNFRQLTGDSGEGSYSSFGFGNGQNNTGAGNTTDSSVDTSDNTDTTDTTEAPTEAPTEPDTPSESDLPAPTDSETTP